MDHKKVHGELGILIVILFHVILAVVILIAIYTL